jgi:hypothetical protein
MWASTVAFSGEEVAGSDRHWQQANFTTLVYIFIDVKVEILAIFVLPSHITFFETH